MPLTRIDLLRKYHRKACGDMFLASDNYLMTEAKPGREEEWRAAQEEMIMIEKWLRELGGKIYE